MKSQYGLSIGSALCLNKVRHRMLIHNYTHTLITLLSYAAKLTLRKSLLRTKISDNAADRMLILRILK